MGKCIFCSVCVHNFVRNFEGHLWNFTQNFEPIHRKICVLLTAISYCDLRYLGTVTNISLSETAPVSFFRVGYIQVPERDMGCILRPMNVRNMFLIDIVLQLTMLELHTDFVGYVFLRNTETTVPFVIDYMWTLERTPHSSTIYCLAKVC